jgi:hypothetical protein
MTRQDFIKIIKLRSNWKIDRRSGNYTLLNGDSLFNYVRMLINTQLSIDELGIRQNGKLCTMFYNYNANNDVFCR